MIRRYGLLALLLVGIVGLKSDCLAQTDDLRRSLVEMLGIPPLGGPTRAESRGVVEHDGVVIEK
jgi:hypothetical protein